MRLPGALAALGTVLVAAGGLIEIADAEPRAQMWLGAAAGAAFLLAVPLVGPATGGDDAEVLGRRARLLVGAGVSAVLAVIGLWQATERNEPRVLLLLVPALLLFVTATLAVREASRTGRALRADRLRSRLDGQESERRRWAQELHDQTLQDLAAVEVRLAGLARSAHGRAEPEVLTAGLEETRAMVREQIRSLRHLVTRMRPLALDTLGLAAALQDLADRAERDSGVEVTCSLEGLPARLRPDAEVSVYRIVQEAVTNAVRHAACHRVDIAVRTAPGRLLVTVEDDGIGLPAPDVGPDGVPGGQPDGTGDGAEPASGGFGLVGMTERAESLDGGISWGTGALGGTLVTLSVPLAGVLPTG